MNQDRDTDCPFGVPDLDIPTVDICNVIKNKEVKSKIHSVFPMI